jgi:hypothetical protein
MRGRLTTMLLAAVLGFGCVVLALWVREARTGDRFDLVRWELDTLPNRWLNVLATPFRDAGDDDEMLRTYFALPAGDPERAPLENEVERIVEGRIDAVLRDLGLNARIPLPRTTFPPVDVELAISPQVLVTSPRDVIERRGAELLRPDLTLERAVTLEAQTIAGDPDLSALVVPSGGVATYPAIVSDRSSYGGVLRTSAHEWVHHYLSFYPLGFNYFRDGDLRTINETVADIVGDEVASIVLERWGDPTQVEAAPPAASQPTVDRSAVLRELRLEVDALLAAGRIEAAEARMAEVRQELEDAGYYIRVINQAYFAWYGTYAARPDATDPLGGYLREVRERTGSLAAFVETIRGWTSRADVEAGFVDLGATLDGGD